MMTQEKTQDKIGAKKSAMPEPHQIGQDLVAMMHALTGIMEKETVALQRKDMKTVEATSRDKVCLLREYQDSLTVLANNPAMLKTLDADLRDKLRATRTICENTAKKNASSLTGALHATKNLIETIIGAAIKSTKKLEGYKDPRNQHLELGTHNPVCEPVAFCRTI